MPASTATIPATAAPVTDPDAPIAAKVAEWRAARSDHQVVRDAHRAALDVHRANLALALALGRLLDRTAERAADLDCETAAALLESGPYSPPDDCWRYHGAVGSDGLQIVVGTLLDFDPDGAEAPPVAGHACVEVRESDTEFD